MNRFAFLTCLLFTAPAFAEDDFTSLFNGKDLTGWKGDPDLWSVEDGTITGKTNGPDHLKYNKFLIWDGKVADFELRLKFRMEGDSNSGVQYRSQHLKDAGEFVVGGYQADIHPKPEYTGMLYDERGRGILAQRGQKVTIDKDGKKQVSKLDTAVTPIKLTDWHELTIICRGNHLIHKIDGKTTVEIIDEQDSQRELEGVIAFQVHRGPAMKAQFKDIRLKKLGGKEKQEQQKQPAPAKPKPAKKAAPRSAKKLPRPENAKPQWIWLSENGKPAAQVCFRREFDVRGVVAARLYATCDNVMTVYIDGKKVLTHDDWSSPAFKDLTPFIDKSKQGGKQVIAIEAENIGEDNPAGLLVKLDLESGWRDAWSAVSDTSWQASTSPPSDWRTAKSVTGWKKPEVVAEIGGGPWTGVTLTSLIAAAPLREPTATPVEQLKVAEGFKVELLYTVPKDREGSWVNLCVDPKGRLIVSDQYGGLYRVTPPPIGSGDAIKLEKIEVDIGEAQGLLWAFDSLYVVVNRGQKYDSGLYRVTDSDGDDKLDTLETLRKLEGGGEHGPHAILLAPDGKSLYVVCGDSTKLTEFATSRVPRVWDEDLLLPRTYGRGFMKGVPAPGGYISRIDPDGKNWELIATGFRNQFDAAFNMHGDLFTFDADMEWDMNTPWYRPTRVNHVVSGVDFGWRNGAGKWPAYYPESLPATVDIGPGSPTGICFGYHAKFPNKYQNALFISDWSYGKLYAVHLKPRGASYSATFEEFITGTPLPLTDVVVSQHDKAMYFAIGGRRVQSGLYRVTYTGKESTNLEVNLGPDAAARGMREKLERLHVGDHPDAVEFVWHYLNEDDQFLRHAARIAIEHRPVKEWQQRALDEQDRQASLTGLLALVRQFPREKKGTGADIDPPPPTYPAPRTGGTLQQEILAALSQHDWNELSVMQRVELLRVYSLCFLRLGPPNEPAREALIATFDAVYPANSREVNSELTQMLVYLQAPSVAAKAVALLESSPTQEEQIDMAKSLRHLRTGWTPELRETYFQWFTKAGGYRGGASFSLFVQHIKEDAVALLSDAEKTALKSTLEAKPAEQVNPFSAKPRPIVKEWKFEELVPLVQQGLKGRDFDHGRKMFGAGNCFACHRFDNQGGAVGPDLTALSGRFSPRDILESIVDPSKTISDQYAAVNIITIKGQVITGRIVNLAGDSIRINTNMLDPDAQVGVDRKQIDEMVPSKISMMPTGLLNTMNEEEVLDLMAYLLSRGDRNHEMFQK